MSNLDNLVSLTDDDSKVNLAPVWAAIDSPIYRVIDEDGVNVSQARIRRLTADLWLYVDDIDGYEILDDGAGGADSLLCVPEADHVPMGWDRSGNVVPM